MVFWRRKSGQPLKPGDDEDDDEDDDGEGQRAREYRAESSRSEGGNREKDEVVMSRCESAGIEGGTTRERGEAREWKSRIEGQNERRC